MNNRIPELLRKWEQARRLNQKLAKEGVPGDSATRRSLTEIEQACDAEMAALLDHELEAAFEDDCEFPPADEERPPTAALPVIN